MFWSIPGSLWPRVSLCRNGTLGQVLFQKRDPPAKESPIAMPSSLAKPLPWEPDKATFPGVGLPQRRLSGRRHAKIYINSPSEHNRQRPKYRTSRKRILTFELHVRVHAATLSCHMQRLRMKCCRCWLFYITCGATPNPCAPTKNHVREHTSAQQCVLASVASAVLCKTARTTRKRHPLIRQVQNPHAVQNLLQHPICTHAERSDLSTTMT